VATTTAATAQVNTNFAPAPVTPTGDEQANTFKWLIGWLVVIVLACLANRTRIGHTFIYYGLWLLLVFLIVTQYKFIVAVLGPVGSPLPTSGDK
jgi:ABC-type polysaccharide/polyol phosphate export permease